MKTETRIKRMLTENTGRALCDSGGAYGRNWEKNQGKDFTKEPSAAVTFNVYTDSGGDLQWDVDFTVSLFHFLRDKLTYHPELTRAFRKFANTGSRKDDSWYENIAEFTEKYGSHVYSENSYNEESMQPLSQVIQWTEFDWENPTAGYDERVCLLEVHGGCDVRGGYTAPVAFALNDDSIGRLTCTIQCDGPQEEPSLTLPGLPETDIWQPNYHYWDTSWDGYSFTNHDSQCGEVKLGDYEITRDSDERGKGKLYVDNDGNGYCPICGSVLRAAYY